MRLNRFLARSGAGSRRGSEELIAAGRVTLNGSVADSPALRVREGDEVLLDGLPVSPPEPVTAALNKPAGYVTAMSGGYRKVSELMSGLPPGTVPVGRLDVATSGLLLLSGDGRLVHRLTHPRWEVEREYLLIFGSDITPALARSIAAGADIGGGRRSVPRSAEVLGPRSMSLVLVTGRNREVRRLVAACGGDLEGLSRVRYGNVSLGSLPEGSWRPLEDSELERLRSEVGLGRGGDGGRA